MSFTSAITGDAKRISTARKSPVTLAFATCALLALAGCHTPGHFGMANSHINRAGDGQCAGQFTCLD